MEKILKGYVFPMYPNDTQKELLNLIKGHEWLKK